MEENEYYVPISYEEWKKKMKIILINSYHILSYYIKQYYSIDDIIKKYGLPDTFTDFIKEYYSSKIKSQLEVFLENLDTYNIGVRGKDRYAYYMDVLSGTPMFSYHKKKDKDMYHV